MRYEHSIISRLTLCVFLVGLTFASHVLAAEKPDELYEQGRFAEAEKGYARLDMDHPKDIRYRYNRGCAAYQNADYQGAMAAFGSVSKRTKDNDVRFRATYNLGNTAFKLGDMESAVEHYKRAILSNPDSEDARYNLELALRKLEEKKKEKTEEKKTGPPKQKRSDSQLSKEQSTDRESLQQESQEEQQESPEDLSGEGETTQPLTGQQGARQPLDSTISTMDRKMAEALLDNIKEDRSRLSNYQVSRKKWHGVQSGKDW
jgi:Ca-activated chloride channel family protein